MKAPLHSATATVILAAMACAVPPARGAVTEAWVQRSSGMAGNSNDVAVAVARDAAGDIVVAGNSDEGVSGFDMLTIKYAGADGSVLWQRRYNNPAGGVNNSDEVAALAVDHEGNVLVTGRTYHQTHGYDWYTAKYAGTNGTLLWEKHHDPGDLDEPQSLAVDPGGHVIVSGSSYSGSSFDTHLIKYAAEDGAPLWTTVISGTAETVWETGSALAVDNGGDVVVSTRTRTAKYSGTDGALVWESPVSSAGKTALALDADGNVVTGLAGAYDDGNGNHFDYRLVKHAAADGARLWDKGITDPEIGSNDLSDLAVDGGGNVVVGRTATITPAGATAYYTAKFAAGDGALIWEERYGGPEHYLAQAVAVDASGNVLVTGYSRFWHPGQGYNNDIHTIKYAAADGAVLWEAHYDGPAENSDDFPGALLVDGGGNVVVTGSSGLAFRPDDSLDYYTAKYEAAGGAMRWESRCDGPANTDDRAQAVAMDSGGNVIVTGYSAHGSLPVYGNDYYTAKYAATTGALLWERRYDSGTFSVDEATVVVVDSGDNVVVTGTSATVRYLADGTLSWVKPGGFNSALAVDAAGNVIVGSGFSYIGEIVTAKYAAADGALLWAIMRGASGVSRDLYVSAVAVDREGNVIVTGAAAGDGSPDYYTAKYAAATGAVIWERRFDSLFQEGDVATALAVGSDGSVVVTGHSYKDALINCGDSDYHTIKYAAADGAVLWERRYDSPCGDDFANAVALDASGNVLVTGSSERIEIDPDGNSIFLPQSYTAKYAAIDGALLWERRDDHGRGSVALGVDDEGDAVVTGPRFADFYTAKYAAADGRKLWSRTSKRVGAYAPCEMGSWGPLSPSPQGMGDAHSLAIGPDGRIAITGSVDGDSGPKANYDFETIVFREIQGPVSFAAWVEGFRLTGEDAAPHADPDDDGMPSASEYVFGGSPVSPAAPPQATAVISGGNVLFTFSRSDASETEDTSLAVEFSTDLVRWQTNHLIGHDTATSSFGVTISENGDAPDTITVAIPIGTGQAKFARLKVMIAP